MQTKKMRRRHRRRRTEMQLRGAIDLSRSVHGRLAISCGKMRMASSNISAGVVTAASTSDIAPALAPACVGVVAC